MHFHTIWLYLTYLVHHREQWPKHFPWNKLRVSRAETFWKMKLSSVHSILYSFSAYSQNSNSYLALSPNDTGLPQGINNCIVHNRIRSTSLLPHLPESTQCSTPLATLLITANQGCVRHHIWSTPLALHFIKDCTCLLPLSTYTWFLNLLFWSFLTFLISKVFNGHFWHSYCQANYDQQDLEAKIEAFDELFGIDLCIQIVRHTVCKEKFRPEWHTYFWLWAYLLALMILH